MTKSLASVPFHLMRQLFQEHTAAWQQALPELTKQQFSVLCAVAAQPGIEQVDLIDAALSTKATLAEMLMRMEKKGLVRRQQGEQDRRRRFIFLTALGETTLQQATPLASAVDNAFLSRLASAEQQQLIALLQQMVGDSHYGEEK
ncbi:MarR family winged helix-turn-helix transcriptional regulator [Erwinia sp. V71]|uniref:MarR family winged helix-turn-helix transcriptional regulator n=1 Tax=Erwinia sp. V71 TaxID=3369424 RepID=UPI003F5E7D40